MNLRPCLAVSWSNPDDNTWRFELRKGVIFQDGQPFTAMDAKYTIDRALKDPNSFIKAEIPEVKEVKVIDEHTIDVITIKPYPLLLAKMSYIMIVPQNSGEYLRRKSNGTGPYRLISYVDGEKVSLERFDRYWAQKPHWMNRLELCTVRMCESRFTHQRMIEALGS